MKIYCETSLEQFDAWSGGEYTLDVLREKDLCDRLEQIIEYDIFPDGCSDTELNDFLWFEDNYIAELLGFDSWKDLENDREEEEEEEEDDEFEAIEPCPHCGEENVYPMWDVNEKGFVAICRQCGKEIMLCDECIHHEDGLNKNSCGCDWHETECGGKCFRGITRD